MILIYSNFCHVLRDFTLKNAEEHDYFGVIIPKSIVYQVGQMNGYVWYAALQFLDDL